MSMFKSKLQKKSEIDYNKQFTIDQLLADPKMLQIHAERLKAVYKDATDDFIRTQIDQIILKENAFNKIMQYLTSNFSFQIDATELDDFKKRFKAQFNETDETKLTELSKKLIMKGLVFEQIIAQNNLWVDDNQVKTYLDNYYKTTNQPINEYLNNKDKFEEIRNIILEEKTTQWLIQRFRVWIDLKTLVRFDGSGNDDNKA